MSAEHGHGVALLDSDGHRVQHVRGRVLPRPERQVLDGFLLSLRGKSRRSADGWNLLQGVVRVDAQSSDQLSSALVVDACCVQQLLAADVQRHVLSEVTRL